LKVGFASMAGPPAVSAQIANSGLPYASMPSRTTGTINAAQAAKSPRAAGP